MESPPRVTATRPSTSADRTFRWSLLVSGVRCTLQYLVLPWLLPLFGFAGGVGVGLTFAIGLVAIGFNGLSIRRMLRSVHSWRTAIIAINTVVIALLFVLLIQDAVELWA